MSLESVNRDATRIKCEMLKIEHKTAAMSEAFLAHLQAVCQLPRDKAESVGAAIAGTTEPADPFYHIQKARIAKITAYVMQHAKAPDLASVIRFSREAIAEEGYEVRKV